MTINLSNGSFQTNAISIFCARDELGYCVSIEMDNGITINFEVKRKSEVTEEIANIVKFYGYATSINFSKFDSKDWV
tara:strand:- start:578 stop:808 length:231 start_codon:yes stop_codon:yes gene_type:complete